MILLTDTFGVEQIDGRGTISIEKIEIAEVQAALAQGSFDVYFEFEELALDAQDVLGVEVPETEQQHKPRFKDDFGLIVVGYVEADKGIFVPTFWRVAGVVRPAILRQEWEYVKDIGEYIAEVGDMLDTVVARTGTSENVNT
jgi:hypothetical protein